MGLPLHAVFIVGLYAAPFVLTWAALRGWAPRRESGRLWLPVPASSLHPLGASLSAVGLPVALTSTMPFLPGLDAWSRAAERHGFELRIVAAMAMALVMIWLLQVPNRVAARLSRASHARVDAQAVSRAALGPLVPTLVFIAALVVTEELLSVNALPSAVGTSALSTALLLDGWGALKARRRANELVCIWQERRPYLVPPVLAAAADDGITLHALGVGQASLLRIFGPYASVGLWCERADVPRALPLVAARLAEPPGAESESSEERAANPAKPTFGGGRHAVPFFTVTALIALLASIHYSAESGLRSFGGGPVNPRASFEVLEVDDEHDPLGELQGASLPTSATLYQEDLRRGDPDSRRHFLRVTLRENETLSDALRPISPVLKALPRTPDARWIWERLRDEAGGGAPARGPTYRSYLVRSEPRFTTRDLSSVELVGGDNGASWSTLRLDAEAAMQLRLFSREHLGERMVIALDDEVVSVAMLTTELKGGVLTIQHGWGTPEEQHAAAADFVQKLTAR